MEVSQDKKSPDKLNKLKRQNLKPLGNKSTPLLKSNDERPSWLLSKDKVRKLTNVLYLKTRNSVRHKRSLKRKVHFTASDEEANIAAHPKSLTQLVCLLNFLMPPFQLGNQPGDAERFDHKGNLKIIKEELVSDSSKTESESDEVEIVEVNPQGTTEPSPGNL